MDGGMHNGQRSLWEILGTEPTGDERALKRAYAKRLKVTRPEDDPAAFQELREAYEYALRHAHLFAGELPEAQMAETKAEACLLYTSPSPRDQRGSRMPSSA